MRAHPAWTARRSGNGTYDIWHVATERFLVELWWAGGDHAILDVTDRRERAIEVITRAEFRTHLRLDPEALLMMLAL